LLLAAIFALKTYLAGALNENPRWADFANKQGQSLMLSAAQGHNGKVKLLIDAGANVNKTPEMESCLFANTLQAAAIGGHRSTANLLLDAGADINSIGGRYGNALQAAAYHGQEEVVESLSKRGGSTRVECYHGYAIHAAAHSGNDSLVEFLLDIGENVNCKAGKLGSALACAVEKGHATTAQLLIQSGADVNAEGPRLEYTDRSSLRGALGLRATCRAPASKRRRRQQLGRFGQNSPTRSGDKGPFHLNDRPAAVIRR
jgi:ankyrin repeat protein